MAKIDAITTTKFTYDEGSAASTPASAKVVTYAKADGLMYSKDDAGVETLMSSGPAGSGGAVVWLQRQTASASATLDFTSFISSTYDVYRFDFISLICATDNVNLTMRMGTGAGPSYDSSGTYHWQNTQGQGTTLTGSNANTGTAIQLTPVVDNATSSAWTIAGSILMFNPMSSTINKLVQGQFTSLFNTGPAFAQNIVAGSYSQTTAVTAVRFLASSGNITSGSIDCYGLKHA